MGGDETLLGAAGAGRGCILNDWQYRALSLGVGEGGEDQAVQDTLVGLVEGGRDISTLADNHGCVGNPS